MDYANIPGTGRDTSPQLDGTEVDGDSVQMIPEIAAAAAAAARTGGVPLIADANGVIVLPAGATLDDIKAVGQDLVITLDNGQVFVIPGGAIDVPQIVIDGIAVPPLNLAALLISGEPIQPAAGLPNSSGNNFFEDAGPIQGAFPIGDLLPPTEFGFAAEPNLEVIPQPIDRDPVIGIITVNQPVAVSDATANVAESGLPARNGEPAGSNAAANSETTSGTIVFNSPDGLTSLTINGTTFTGPGQSFTSPRGTLTITTFDPVGGTANFTYTLTDNVVGGTVADQFTVILTDPDGDVATSTLTINVADDAPTARNDTDAVPAGSFAAQTGNVITGVGTTSGAAGVDTLGADNASITRIASNNVAANTDTSFDSAGNLQVSGQYGVLTIKADGSYSFTRNPGTPGGVSDAFTYTLTDADGSASTATLTIAIADAVPVITSVPPAGSAATIVAESGLPARTGEAPGSNAPAPTETTSGTITFAGGDGPVTATINGVVVAVGAIVTTPTGTLTVSAFDPVTGTIGYTFTLADNTPGDTTGVTFNLVVTDVDGDTAPGSFTITIADDVPLAVNDSATQATENAPITVNALGNDIQGADSVAFSAVVAVPGTLSGTGTLVNNANGTFTYTPGAGEQGTVTFDYTITDGDGDTSRATVTIALLADSTPTISVAGDNTVSEAALPARGEEPAGSNAASPDETAVGTIPVTTGGDTVASLVINDTNVTAGGTVTTAKGVLTVTRGEGGAYSYSYTLADNTLADPDSDSFSVTVTDSDGDTASTSLVIAIADDTPTARDDAGSVAAGTYGPIAGSVTANDTPGADGIVVLSYARGDSTVLAGATLQGQYGTLSIAANGTYSYTRDAGTPGGVSDSFAYTVRDGDGDLATANLVITIADSDTTLTIPIAGTPGSTQVLEAGLPAGSASETNGEFASGTFSFTAPDGPATVTIGNTVVTTVGQTIAGTFGTLTITSIASGSIGYTYQLTTNTDGNDTSDAFAVVITDQDDDSSTGTLTIAIVDDVPTARADVDSVKEDGPTIATGNVVTAIDRVEGDTNATDGVADTKGADGASVTAVAFLPVAGGSTAGTVGDGLAGAFGTLTLAADGSYTYTLSNTNSAVQGLDDGEVLTETFSYTLTDGDTDASTTTLTITINGTNDAPVVGTGAATVSEEGLANANADDAGDTDTTNSATATGTISVTDADIELLTVTLGNPGAVLTSGGVAVTWSGVDTGTLTGSAGDTPVIRIAIDNAGAYTVTLLGPVDQAIANVEDVKTFTVPVNAFDGTVTTSNVLTVTIEDDSPLAASDTDAVTEDGPTSATGNVLTGAGSDGNLAGADSIGADGPAEGGAVVALAGGTVGTPLAGTYGSLTLNATGAYTYTLNNALPVVQALDDTDQPLTETFTYTIRDRDGDTATATLTITVNGTNDAPVVGTGIATVSEEGLQGANVDAVGNTDTTDSASFSGTISITDADVEPSFVTLGNPGAVLTSGGVTVTWSGVDTGTLTGSAGDSPVIRIAIDNAGFYTVTLLGPVDQATANVEDVKTFVVPVNVSDGTATVPTTLTVTIEDDSPLAANDTDAVTEDGPTSATGNVLTGAGSDGNIAGADSIGADGPAAGGAVTAIAGGTVGSPLAGTYGSLTLSANGSYTYALNNTDPRVQGLDGDDTLTETFTYTISDRDGDTTTATLLVTINGANDPVTITGLNVDGGEKTVFEANLSDGSAANSGALTQTGTFSVAGTDGIATITVGNGLNAITVFSGGVPITGQTFNAAFGTLTITSVTPVLDAAGDTVSATIGYSYTLNDNTLTHTASGNDSLFDSFAVTVTDTDGSTATDSLDVKVVDDTPTANPDTNMVAEGATTTGNVLTDGTDDVFGADGPTTVPAGGVVLVNGVAPGTPIVTALGTLTLNANGSYTYVSNPNTISTPTVDSFTYTIRDADGDLSQTTLDITINAVNGMVADVDVDVDESGLDTIGSQAVPNGEFDTNGQITVTGATGTFTYTLTSSPLTPYGTLLLNAGTGAYSYTLTRPFDNSDANDGRVVINGVESYGYRVTDQFGNEIGTGSIVVNVRDDIPTAFADTAIMVAEDGNNVGGNLLANDIQGADRATVTEVTIGGASSAVTAVGTTTISTAAGVYTFQANGTWTFDPALNQNNNTSPVNANFTYTITDGDGDISRAAQVINVVDGANPQAGDAITLTVDDEDLANGSSPLAAPPVTSAGTITFTAGSDTIASIVFDTVLTSLNSTNLIWTRESAIQIVGRDSGSGLTVVTLDLVRSGNSATITATLSNNYDAHPTLGDDLVALGSVNVVATDSDGDFVSTAVNVRVSDDIPAARNDSAVQGAENTAILIDALLNDTKGADGVNTADATKVFVVTQATQGVVTYDTATGKFTYTPNPGAGSTGTSDQFTYRIVDGDGDISTAIVSITLKPDSAPMVKTTTNLSVDEDGFPAHNPDGGALLHPAETAGSNSLTDLTGSAVVNFGNDVPTSLLASIVLVDNAAYDTQLKTLDGAAVTFAIESGALVGRSGGVEAIRIAITGATPGPLAGDVTYTYSTTLSQPLQHTATGEDTLTLTGVTFRVTDSDTDTTTGSFNVAILDDVPAIDVTKGADTGVLLTTQDAETDGIPTDTDTAVSTASFGGVFALASNAGSDGTATAPALAYSLAVTNAASGLTSGGVAITLAMQGATVVGSAGVTPVFSIAVASDGTVTLSQFQQIDHATEATPAPGTDAPFDDQFAILADGKISLTASAMITDRDGDTISDSETIDLGGNIRFADDGPVLSNVSAGAAVSVDESNAGVNFLAPAFVTMTSTAAAITATSAFGADGAAMTGATTYGLTIVGNGTTTLQTAVTNQAITLVQTDDSTITGQYGGSLTAFTLTINANGTTTLTQNVALEHNTDGNTAADYNDTLTLAGLVNATITLKDFDGDTATASTGIGGNVTFFDDGVAAVLDTGTVPAGSAAAIMGNVLTNDYRGVDGSAITLVTNTAANSSDNTVDVNGNFVLSGQYGLLTLNATTGAYTYARTPGAGGGSSDVFTYTLTDSDGDFAATTLTIAIGDLLPVATTASATVDDEGLLGGIVGALADGDIDANAGDAGPNTSEAIFQGVLGGTPGDGTNTFLFGATLNATTRVVGQETVTYTVSLDGSLLTAIITASPDATRLTNTLYTVKITDQTTGAYTLTLVDNVLHANANLENDVDITVAYQLRDADAVPDLSTTGVLSIKFDDDIPTANAFSVTQTAENTAISIPLAAQFAAGADGLAATGGITFTDGAQGTVSLIGTTLTYTPASGAGSTGTSDSFTYTITDADGDAVTRTVSVTLVADSVPTLSVTDVTVNEKGLAKGSGEYADHFGAGENLNSDTSETATGSFTITTGGDTVQKVEVQGGNGTFVNVTAATVGSPITVTGNTGTLTVTSNGAGVYSYSYTLTQNLTTHNVAGAGDTKPGDSFAVRVTDSDNDVTTVTAATTIDVTVIDDAPVVFAKDTPIQIANSGNVAGTGNFDFTVGADQRTDFTGTNSDFGTIVLTGTVGGTQTISPTNLVRTTETATSATFTFSFNYSASGATQTETGTLVFDKTSGSYTVDLATPIQASVSPPSVSGSTSIVGYQSGTANVQGSQPDVSVARITSDLFVQFIGFNDSGQAISSPPAPNNTFVNGDTLSGARAFVSVSGAANGVAGDTMGKGEVIDLDFFTTDPKGFDALTPDARVSTIFVKMDGIGNNEDFIVILKVYDTVLQTFSTRALYVANGDIIKGTAPAAYSGITLDNNDGLIIIEPNDYRIGAGDANLVLVGAQITATDEGITGPAINFNGVTGTSGASVTGQNLSNDTNDTGFKISDIGFLTTTTTIQNATLNFTFQLKDSEGDLSPVQVLTANVVNQTTPIGIDLDGGGVQFTGLDAGTTFNYGEDASRVTTAWVGKGDGLLAIDLNANHQVDSGKEIVFGTGTLGDLAGLAAAYDTNHDGALDAADASFAQFGVWQDADSDGVSDAGEFHTLGELEITSIGLVSDGVAYTAANGDVTVAGSSTYTRADGSTGTVADAAFATAALDKLEAKTLELTAANAAAAGALAAAAAVAALPVAAAEVAPATAANAEAPASASLQTVPETHEALRPVADTLTSHEAAKVPAETASHGDEAPASASNLAATADHATSPVADSADDAAGASPVAAATADFGGDAGQLMDALLAAAQAAKGGVAEAGQHVQDLAAVTEAFGDSHGAALVDAMVDHFAGAQAALPVGGADALAELFASHVGGSDSFGPAFDLNQMLSDMSAHAAAQV